MQDLKTLQEKIFSIRNENDFGQIALEVFRFQYKNNLVYKSFVQHLNLLPEKIRHWTQIPFLPIEFFKTHRVQSFKGNAKHFFASSGTTGINTSKHYIADFSIYEKSFLKGFELFWRNPQEYVILALLPNYLEQRHSSLVYMISRLIRESQYKKSGFYKTVDANLINCIRESGELKNRRLLLFGVTYSLLDLIEKETFHLPNAIIFETGGMKGRRKEMIREELHSILCKGFGVSQIASEYGMTELFSQAYSSGNGIFTTPPWMKIRIREINDPFHFAGFQQTGGISVMDLANLYSCSFIATQDLGKQYIDGSFEILGRFDNSEIRGCNLLAL